MHICPDEINMLIFLMSGVDIRYLWHSVVSLFVIFPKRSHDAAG